MRNLFLAALGVAVSGLMSPALAWDSGPWDPAPFGQPLSQRAEVRAQIAAARAARLAMPSRYGTTTNDARGGGAQSGSACDTGIGSVILPATGRYGDLRAFTNVRINGNVTLVCGR
ncbi:hypothetical protein [Falsiroseomonas stagni]|uniref:Peptidase inhibitor I78 family protein n=1 Tax=Falsiroseomonas stagni DSM 19981 TaxID=1123062 RepID=A0A1I4F8G1_9PROT|nr:hypothetical protein [Falsiroseomonas stagni]SFL13137.1 hypothetical protein SAMN02745775_12328 [Falsiroseomonas stagni DSM 19981]